MSLRSKGGTGMAWSEDCGPMPYASPQLVRYGSLVDLTQANLFAPGPFDNPGFCMGQFCQFLFKSL